MDIRELLEDPEETLRTAISGVLGGVFTALPAIVSADSDGHTLSAVPTIKAQITAPDGTVSRVPYPLLTDIPVHFPGGGGITLTHPIKQNDEVLIVFSSRPIDVWFQNGGTQLPIDGRTHSLSDGMAIPGWRSTPRKIQNISTSSTQIRTDDAKHVIDVHPQNGLTFTSSKAISHSTPNFTFTAGSGGVLA